MLVSMAGGDFVVNAGEMHECDAAEAKRLIEAGFAEAAESRKVESRESKKPAAKRGDD